MPSAPSPVTFSYTGGLQTYTVPTGVTSLKITAIGAADGSAGAGSGGRGASITGTISVAPGDVLAVAVGGQDGSACSGGGGAGGIGSVGAGSDADGAGGGGGPSTAAPTRSTSLALGVAMDWYPSLRHRRRSAFQLVRLASGQMGTSRRLSLQLCRMPMVNRWQVSPYLWLRIQQMPSLTVYGTLLWGPP
jgi:hypothetical protein